VSVLLLATAATWRTIAAQARNSAIHLFASCIGVIATLVPNLSRTTVLVVTRSLTRLVLDLNSEPAARVPDIVATIPTTAILPIVSQTMELVAMRRPSHRTGLVDLAEMVKPVPDRSLDLVVLSIVTVAVLRNTAIQTVSLHLVNALVDIIKWV